jgi:hypothetical protein
MFTDVPGIATVNPEPPPVIVGVARIVTLVVILE